MNTPNKEREHQDKHMCETHTPVDVTGSLPSEITASDAAANGQAPAQQEQQTPMMPSHETLEQSPPPDRSAQESAPAELRQLPQADLQQSRTHTVSIREQTAQRCGDKDSQQHQAPATPLQMEDAAAEPIPQSRDKETQVTVSNKDAMVQTDTPT